MEIQASQNPLQDGDGHALKAFLNRRTGWRKGLDPRRVGSNALRHHRLTSGLNFTQNRRFEFAVAAAAGAVD